MFFGKFLDASRLLCITFKGRNKISVFDFVYCCDFIELNLIKVKCLGGEASPLSPPLDETLAGCMYHSLLLDLLVTVNSDISVVSWIIERIGGAAQ